MPTNLAGSFLLAALLSADAAEEDRGRNLVILCQERVHVRELERRDRGAADPERLGFLRARDVLHDLILRAAAAVVGRLVLLRAELCAQQQ